MRAWWVAPTYRQAAEGWDLIKFFGRQVGADIKEADRVALFPGGGKVECKTADSPDSLRGAGLDFVVLDECRDMKPDTWTHVLRPALADRQGRALFISTPNGLDWFADLFQRGEDPLEHEWASFTYPTSDNPHIKPEELKDAEKELPDAVFRQEFLAEFVDASGLVFRYVREASTGKPAAPDKGGRYCTFVDLASTYDFNAVAVFRVDGAHADHPVQVHAERWNRTGVDVSLARIKAIARRYPGQVSIDATGLGGGFAHEWLDDIGANGFKFTNELKQSMVTHLQAMLEHRRVTLLDPDSDPAAKVQYNELLAYTAKKMPSGAYRYEAPSGKHDDMATAVMGALWRLRELGEPAAPILQSMGII